MLSLVVVGCFKGDDRQLEKSEECEFPEDSDCESECELASNPVSGNAKVGCGEGREQKLLPVLKIGSVVS